MSANETTAWRLFVAVSIPEIVVAGLTELQQALRSALPHTRIRWSKPANMHLTLRFLGDVDCVAIEALEYALNEVARELPPLDLIAERIGCFPSMRFPRILWAWVHDGSDELPLLVRRLRGALAPFAGNEPEPRFLGHITIGRCHRIAKEDRARLAELADSMTERVFGTWHAEGVLLMRSELTQSGSIYTEIRRFKLAARP